MQTERRTPGAPTPGRPRTPPCRLSRSANCLSLRKARAQKAWPRGSWVVVDEGVRLLLRILLLLAGRGAWTAAGRHHGAGDERGRPADRLPGAARGLRRGR